MFIGSILVRIEGQRDEGRENGALKQIIATRVGSVKEPAGSPNRTSVGQRATSNNSMYFEVAFLFASKRDLLLHD